MSFPAPLPETSSRHAFTYLVRGAYVANDPGTAQCEVLRSLPGQVFAEELGESVAGRQERTLCAIFRLLVTGTAQEGRAAAAPPFKGWFAWMTAPARAWRERVKQTIIVLNSKGAKLTEQNIKDVFGPRWAWKMAKLFAAVEFVVGEWQDRAVQDEIGFHNLRVRASWLFGGGDGTEREHWWHVVELTLDHLRPSPKWIKQGQELALAKESEALAARGLVKMGKERKKQEEKMRMLREVADLFAWEWQPHTGVSLGSRIG